MSFWKNYKMEILVVGGVLILLLLVLYRVRCV